MPGISSRRPYTLLARFYDQLQPQIPRMNRFARQKILRRILPKVRTVCELGCGTGETSLDFARRGRKVYAVDLSPTMCRLTRQKARRARLPVRVLCADMRSFRLPKAVDLVTCEFGSLNHLPRQSDLARVARAVARALRPGGYFYLDVDTARTFQQISNMSEKVETKDFVAFFSGHYSSQKRKARLEIDWFVPAGKRWRRQKESVDHIWWKDSEIPRALRRAGFRRIRRWDGVEVRPAWIKPRPSFDTYYLAQKIRGT
ncbi:class I SAM-dependent methyltransferase [Acidobacteriia bacterium AH_259_A11_L15]|nr:class I SAM-dependent methyltransferase [Acidobacteriia bacterium AH_259_A11_L15]